MNTAEMKRVIQDQEIERIQLAERENIIEREISREELLKALAVPNILAILGIRRCGKSVLSWNILKGNKVGYINFDDESLYGIEVKDLNVVLKAFYELYGDPEFIILDEIQNVSGWELFANRLRITKKVIITGSNSNLLSGELSTQLTGRHTDFNLFPFSFKEFLMYNKFNLEEEGKFEYSTKFSAKLENLLEKYISSGGLPEAYKIPGMSKTVFSDIIQKDIVRRYRIKNVSVIESMAKYLISNFSNEMTFSKLKNVFSIGRMETIKKYVKYLQDAHLIIVLERFSFKLKQQLIAPKKVYCMDTGIINSIAFRFTEDPGKFIENLVAVELLRRKSYSRPDTEVYYYKDHQQREVDFVVKEGLAIKQLIQVCYNIDDLSTKERELKALDKASSELKCKNLLIITWDYESEEDFNGNNIKFIPLWKWLIY